MTHTLQFTEFTENVFGIYKPAGYTPLQTLETFRAQKHIPADISLTYAGRLDPMAEGLLLVLAGEAVHRKDEFLKQDKTYVVTALLGVETDSFDLLGMPKIRKNAGRSLDSGTEAGMTGGGLGEEKIQCVLQSYIGEKTFPLPLYSSPPVDGKPLFQHAQQNSLQAQNTPTRTTTIYSCTLDALGTAHSDALLTYLHKTSSSIHGDFRQTATLKAWEDLLAAHTTLQSITCTVRCSSGTYIRSLVQDLGTQLGTAACVYTLLRTQVGTYKL